MEHDHDPASQTNMVLIVIVLVLIVGFGVWWFTSRNTPADDSSGINVDVNLPEGNNSSPGSNSGGTTTPQ